MLFSKLFIMCSSILFNIYFVASILYSFFTILSQVYTVIYVNFNRSLFLCTVYSSNFVHKFLIADKRYVSSSDACI